VLGFKQSSTHNTGDEAFTTIKSDVTSTPREKKKGDNRAQTDDVWLRSFSLEIERRQSSPNRCGLVAAIFCGKKTINGLPYKSTLEQAKEEQRAVPRY
jgi:hypothetical protein